MLDGIQNTGFLFFYIQLFPFCNFSFEFLFNGVVFIQYWIKMIHPVMDHFFLHLIVEQMILCKNHVIADCFQCFCYYWNRFFYSLCQFCYLGF